MSKLASVVQNLSCHHMMLSLDQVLQLPHRLLNFILSHQLLQKLF